MIKRNASYFIISVLLATLMGGSGCCRLAAQRLAEPIPVAVREEAKQPRTPGMGARRRLGKAKHLGARADQGRREAQVGQMLFQQRL